MGVDFSDLSHLRYFRRSLPEVYRVIGTQCWLFYHMGENWAVDTATKEIFEQHGFESKLRTWVHEVPSSTTMII